MISLPGQGQYALSPIGACDNRECEATVRENGMPLKRHPVWSSDARTFVLLEEGGTCRNGIGERDASVEEENRAAAVGRERALTGGPNRDRNRPRPVDRIRIS